jgi:uncharacterized membrane protein YedE/YeeE
MADFSPGSALAGGVLIGSAATLLLWVNGRIAGVCGVLAGLVPPRSDWPWRAGFVGALLFTGLLAAFLAPDALGESPASLPWLAVAGLLVGAGTRLGNGCTSGHGVCGISRLSPRSITATVTFVAFAVLTVALVRTAGGLP